MSTVLEVLIYRILATVVPAFDVIQPILDSFGQMLNHTHEEPWIHLESLLLCHDIKSIFYVIEGIDMCEEEITDHLEALVALAHARSLSCKVLATSQTLNEATSGKATVINLNPLILQRQNLEDIIRLTMRNLGTQIRGFAELEQLIVKVIPGSATPSEIKIRLQVLLHVVKPLTTYSIEKNFLLLQKPVPELYSQILGPLSALMPWVRRALSWMTLSFRPLDIPELAVAVVCQDSLPNQDMLRHLPLDLEDQKRYIASSQTSDGEITVPTEYIQNELTGKLNSGGDYSCDVLTHADLARSCLTYLKHSGVAQAGPREGCRTSWEQSELDFSEYAARYWTYHYRAADNRNVLIRDILDFLSQEKYCFESTPLTLAAEHGLCEVVHDSISSSEDKSVSSKKMTEALEIALQFGHLDVARQLLLETNPSNESLVLASRTEDTELVSDILQKLGDPACTCLESLQAAVIRGNLQAIDILLQLLPDVSSALEDNPSLYLDAIRSGKTEALKRLLDVGRAQLPVEVGSNLLCLAARRGDLDIIRLIQAEGSSTDWKDENGWTILHHAADTGRASVVTELISSYDPEAKDDGGMSPLHIACKKGSISTFIVLVRTNKLSFNAPTAYGDQPIHLAAAGGHLQIVVRLVQLGADPKVSNRKGFTPLHLAAQAGHLAVVRELIRRIGDPSSASVMEEGADSRDYTSSLGNDEEEKEEAENSSDGDSKEEEIQNYGLEPTPLHSATLRGYDDVVRELLEAHVDINFGNHNGSTPLHLSVHHRHTAVVETLLDGGANASLCDLHGRLPIHIASESGNVFIFRASKSLKHIHGYEELVELLLRQGADPNSGDIEGHTPLFCAIQGGNSRVFKALLNAGARITDASQSQSTLIREAVRAGQDGDVIRSLMEAGCDLLG
ncbi:hypothetical protein AKAW_08093 [Aspergillus niger]|uniref:Uncharacterized protein n=1 Tax=Aspergillus niger TaxID=5061 RepID=A0A100INH6_ASPNG|nr:hypothetical protein AKAW_08093 [Aspergillus niger]